MTELRLGFAGVGKMGGLMARRLIEAGHPLTVFDANDLAVEPLVKVGAKRAKTLGELAEQAGNCIWGAALAVEPVRLLGVSAHRLRGHLRRHHPILEPGKYPLLKVTPRNRAGIRAGAVGNTGRTGITGLAAQRA